MKAIVIFSGGQDSTTLLYRAIQFYGADEVHAITFLYGQKHAVELECAKEICKKENVEHMVINVSFLQSIVDSALTSHGNVNETNAKGLPASFVPNRNALFITLAHAYAQKVGAEVLITGVCQTDYSGYPDCRRVFIDGIESVLNMGSMSTIVIETPLMNLTKAQTFGMAADLDRLEDVIEYSHTCYNGLRGRSNRHFWGYGCGSCPACELRKKGFNEYNYSISKKV